MFKKILIANRGECALRIIRACQEMGIATVAIYSEADADSLHVAGADESYLVGPPPASVSYLAAERIIDIALKAGVDAVHPGWGFLAENAAFARRCEEVGLTFIGPPAEAIEAMGDKNLARQMMRRAGLPVVPGSVGQVSDDVEALAAAAVIGYPLMVKASAGGGGIGMGLASDAASLPDVLATCRRRAGRAFGDNVLYLERYIEGARHIEVQIVADGAGQVVTFPERECSLQRRHQKVLEETPSPIVTPDLRQRMGEAARRGAQTIGYANLGTLEFLLDGHRNFYFIEMNTRLQVEHGITEMVTDLDLVKGGIALAAGQPLSFAQEDIVARGHALEARIYAEDPATFFPCPGRISCLVQPSGQGLRLESSVAAGQAITPYYDPMIAKLMAWGETRQEAIARLIKGLESYNIEGIKTNIPLHLAVLQDPHFAAGEYDTHFLEAFQFALKEQGGLGVAS